MGTPVLEPNLWIDGNDHVRMGGKSGGGGENSQTDLYTSGSHVELSCKTRAHNTVRFLVAGEGLFEDFELGGRGPLAVLYLVGDVRIEFSEVDERGIYAWRDDIWDAGVWETRVVVLVHGG